MKSKSQGHTLIEIVFVLAIIGCLGVMAFAVNQTVVQRNSRERFISQLLSAIQLARMAAIDHNETIVFCGSKTGKQCDGNWQAGQLIIAPHSGKIIRQFAPVATSIVLQWDSNYHRQDLTFKENGFTNGQQGSFRVSAKDNLTESCSIIINHSGRVRREGDCMVDNMLH